ncbi:cysteine proteinase, partial [Lichtheimia hyalospora FSU 10163]
MDSASTPTTLSKDDKQPSDISNALEDRFTPAGLLSFLYYQYDRVNNKSSDNNRDSHPHEFIACPVEQDANAPFVCQLCHKRLVVKTLSTHAQTSICSAGATHHYHLQPPNRFQCCGCHYAMQVTMDLPILKPEIFHQLLEERPMHLVKDQAQTPNMVDALKLLLTYVKNLLGGDQRSINSKNPHFQARIGLDDASKSIMACIGYTFNSETDYFDAPQITSSDRSRWITIRDELLACLYSLQDQVGDDTILDAYTISRAMPTLQDILGVDRTKERLMPDAEPTEDDQPELYLGSVAEATDTVIIWLYHLLIQETPDKAHIYMDVLAKEARRRESDKLWTEVALESSKGQLGDTEIKNAYSYYGIDPQAMDMDEDALMELYDSKMEQEPKFMKEHREALQVIANIRMSDALREHLKKTDKTTTGLVPPPPPPRHEGPVGLNNIGNTCYLNSLLQYYNTLVPLRETIIHMDDFVEDETESDWTPKRIGGIEVDHKEVQRAKKFVTNLRELFLNLGNSKARAISPTYDLAYMALLNGKDIEEAQDKSTQKQEEEKPSSTPPPQQQQHQNGQVEKVHQQEQQDSTPASEEQQKEDGSSNGQQEPKDELLANESVQVSDTPASEKAPTSDNNDDSVEPDADKENELPPSYDQVVKEKGTGDSSGALILYEKKPELPRRPSAANMMLGKQQDVTECMSNVMFLIEAALKPLEKKNDEQTRDIVRDLFYFKARQILTYQDTQTLRNVRKDQHEEFAHVMVDAVEGKDLYDGLDEYFFAGRVENFHGGRGATREVTVTTFPPVLQIQVQRVQFDRETSNVYKSNAFIKLEKVIYLDRYSESNCEALAGRRAEVAAWQKEVESNKEIIQQLTENKAYPMPIPQMLEASAAILEEYRDQESEELAQMHEQALQLLKEEANTARKTIERSRETIHQLQQRIRTQYEDLTDIAYRLHAVFIHQGQANYGHYWVYIYNHQKEQWWKYNDSLVTKVDENEIFQNTTGRTANPYFVVYIKESEVERLVDLGVTSDQEGEQETNS